MVRTIVHCQHLLCKNNFIVIDPKKFLSEPTVLVGIDSNSTWEKFVFLQYCFIDSSILFYWSLPNTKKD